MQPPIPAIIRYHWAEGSVPPPGYYEYTIEVSAAGGALTFLPDYPQHHPPCWKETFSIMPDAWAELNRIVQNLWAEPAPPKTDNPYRVGGSDQHITLILPDGTNVIIQASESRLQPAFDAIRSMVPPLVWEQIFARRTAFMENPS